MGFLCTRARAHTHTHTHTHLHKMCVSWVPVQHTCATLDMSSVAHVHALLQSTYIRLTAPLHQIPPADALRCSLHCSQLNCSRITWMSAPASSRITSRRSQATTLYHHPLPPSPIICPHLVPLQRKILLPTLNCHSHFNASICLHTLYI